MSKLLNKNGVKIGDIVFVSLSTNTSLDDFVGKVNVIPGSIAVVCRPDDRVLQRVFINRCSHANESQRKEYFKGCLSG